MLGLPGGDEIVEDFGVEGVVSVLGVEVLLSITGSTFESGLTSLHTDEMKLALGTGLGVGPEESKHSNGPRVKKECTASEENWSIVTGNDDLSVK